MPQLSLGFSQSTNLLPSAPSLPGSSPYLTCLTWSAWLQVWPMYGPPPQHDTAFLISQCISFAWLRSFSYSPVPLRQVQALDMKLFMIWTVLLYPVLSYNKIPTLRPWGSEPPSAPKRTCAFCELQPLARDTLSLECSSHIFTWQISAYLLSLSEGIASSGKSFLSVHQAPPHHYGSSLCLSIWMSLFRPSLKHFLSYSCLLAA